MYRNFCGYARDCGGRHARRHGFGGLFGGVVGGRGFGWHGFRAGRKLGADDLQLVILALLADKPYHGYEIIKALEEKMGGCYTPSAGTVYPTLQLLEDEGYVRVVETDGKKVYHVTPEGERYLEEHRDLLDEILDRVRETVRDFTSGGLGELQGAFAHLAGVTFRQAWRRGPDDPAIKRVAEILRKAGDDVEQAWQTRSF